MMIKKGLYIMVTASGLTFFMGLILLMVTGIYGVDSPFKTYAAHMQAVDLSNIIVCVSITVVGLCVAGLCFTKEGVQA